MQHKALATIIAFSAETVPLTQADSQSGVLQTSMHNLEPDSTAQLEPADSPPAPPAA